MQSINDLDDITINDLHIRSTDKQIDTITLRNWYITKKNKFLKLFEDYDLLHTDLYINFKVVLEHKYKNLIYTINVYNNYIIRNRGYEKLIIPF